MNPAIDIAALRSAEPITDAAAVLERIEKRAPLGGRTTVATLGDDGSLSVRKACGRSVLRMPGELEVRRLADARGIPWNDAYAERAVPYWASDERSDGEGDIVRQSWDFGQFTDNPVLLWSHDWGAPPIGNVLSWEVVRRSEKVYNGPALRLLNLFATGETWAWADTIYRLVRSGFLRAGSVGFQPRNVIDVKDRDERQRLGLGPLGLIFDDNLLLEFSATTIGANPGALTILQRARDGGLLRADDLTAVRELERRECLRLRGGADEWTRRDELLVSCGKMLFPRHEFRDHADRDQPFDAPEPAERKTEPAVGKCGCDGEPAVEDAAREVETTDGVAVAEPEAPAAPAARSLVGKRYNLTGTLSAYFWSWLYPDQQGPARYTFDQGVVELATTIGTDAAGVRYILNGDNCCPTVELLTAIASALGAPLDQLFEAGRLDGCDYPGGETATGDMAEASLEQQVAELRGLVEGGLLALQRQLDDVRAGVEDLGAVGGLNAALPRADDADLDASADDAPRGGDSREVELMRRLAAELA